MTPEKRAQVLQLLWPQGAQSKLSVWAILDCARNPNIYLALLESRLEFRCLYSGKLPRELEMVAPHLVELSPTNRLIGRWLDEGWGQSWGVLLKINDPANLRHHLRKFLKVQDEEGRRLYSVTTIPASCGPTCQPARPTNCIRFLDQFSALSPRPKTVRMVWSTVVRALG